MHMPLYIRIVISTTPKSSTAHELSFLSRFSKPQHSLGQDILSCNTAVWFASFYRAQGLYREAEKLEQLNVETRKSALGQEHPSTLTSMANLASTYRNQGRWKEAEELEVQVMETRKRVLGQEHPDTLTSMANLAWTRKSQGRDMEAVDLMIQAERLQKKILGPDHHLTMSSIQTLCEWQQPVGTDETISVSAKG